MLLLSFKFGNLYTIKAHSDWCMNKCLRYAVGWQVLRLSQHCPSSYIKSASCVHFHRNLKAHLNDVHSSPSAATKEIFRFLILHPEKIEPIAGSSRYQLQHNKFRKGTGKRVSYQFGPFYLFNPPSPGEKKSLHFRTPLKVGGLIRNNNFRYWWQMNCWGKQCIVLCFECNNLRKPQLYWWINSHNKLFVQDNVHASPSTAMK